jgi:hypothetical protein
MSKNIVDGVIEMNSPLFGLLPSLRQIDFNGGYVNNWTTETFYNYVKEKSNILIERDHSGIGQGFNNEYDSLEEDSKYMDIVHVDPWKKYGFFEDGFKESLDNINFLSNLNPKIKFEIGTEEAIRKFELKELVELLSELKIELKPSQFENIEYVCIQSGVGLDLINRKNTGSFNLEKLRLMLEVCKKFKKKSKEHNGDYLSKEDIQIRFDNGLNSLNIGPEIAQIETETYLNLMTESEIEEFYQICLNSKKWKKWVNDDFDVNDRRKMIMVCGHYNFNNLNKNLMNLSAFEDINDLVKENIKNKLKELLSYV